MVVHSGDLTVNGNDILGVFDSNGKLIDFSSYGTAATYGKQEWKKSNFGSWSASSSGNVSQNVLINGTLTINETGRVVLGGQYRTQQTIGIGSLSTTTTHDEYTGIIAQDVVVNGNGSTTNLETTNLTTNTLTVNEGRVSIHTSSNYKQGNTHFVVFDADDSKQVSIREALNINGGTTTIGNGTGANLQTAFGKLTYTGDTWVEGTLISVKSAEVSAAQITQSNGTLKVQGNSVSVGGLQIDQTNGNMSISDGAYHDLADYGDCVITQSGDNASMNLGIIRAYNAQYNLIKEKLIENGVSVELSPSVALNQSGSGTINMSGVDFTAEIGSSSELSSVKQSGSGSINLNGEYKGVTFDVKQTGSGTINVNASMSLNEVTLTDENGKGGKLNVAKGATVSVNSITIDGGRIVNNGTINGVVSMALRSAGDTIHITDGELVNSGTINASINMTGGTLVAEAGSEIAGLTATGGDVLVEGDITMTGDLVLDGDAELIFGDADSIIDLGDYEFVFNGGSIALTLGDKELEDVVLFTGAKENSYYNGYEVTLKDTTGKTMGTAVMNRNEDGTVTLEAAAVPEPTTATLSLLALAALAARRRRK